MAVPSAVTQRMQREEEALRAQGMDPNVPPAAVPSASAPAPAPASPGVVAPAPVDEAAALRAENERLKQELSTQGGRVSATATEVADLKQRFEAINSNRSFLETSVSELAAKNQELERQLAEAQADGVKSHAQSVVSSLDESGPTKEQLEEFGGSQNYVERIVRKELATVIKPLASQLAEIEKVLGRVKAIDAKLPVLERSAQVSDITAARSREEQFLRSEVLPYFSDFETVRTSPEWKEYLSRDTGRGYPIGVLLKTYRESNNAAGIRSVLGAYYEQRKSKPSLDALAVPAKSTADAPTPTPTVKMKASEYKANLRSFTSKRMAKADWDAYRTRWEQALQAGNVEMDEEIR